MRSVEEGGDAVGVDFQFHILDAIARGDSEGARAAMRIRLANSRERRQRARALLR